MTGIPEALWANHTVDRPKGAICSCGDTLPDGLAPHIAAILGIDTASARELLLTAHNNIEVNAGMCGGCDSCGSDAAMAVCRICSEGYSPCPTYFEAVCDRNLPADELYVLSNAPSTERPQ